jgi:HEAT repeat protein
MTWLQERLLNAGVITAAQLEAAIRRAAIYGGSFDTNLLEMGAIMPSVLHALLAYASQAPPAALDSFDAPRPSTETLPPGLREHPDVVPLAQREGRLEVLVHPRAWDGEAQTLIREYPQLDFVAGGECLFIDAKAQSQQEPPPRRYANLAAFYREQLRLPRHFTPTLSRGTTRRLDELWHALFAAHPTDGAELAKAVARVMGHFTRRVCVFACAASGLEAVPGACTIESALTSSLPYSRTIIMALSGERVIERCDDLDLRLAVGKEDSIACVFAPIVVGRWSALVLYVDRDGLDFGDHEIETMVDLCGRAGLLLYENLDPTARESLDGAADAIAAWESLSRKSARITTKGPIGKISECETSANSPVGAQEATTSARLSKVEFAANGARRPRQLTPIELAREPEMQRSATRHLQDDHAGVLEALRLFDDSDPQRREAAIRTFQELRDARCIWPLAKLGFDADESIRTLAMQVLETYRLHATFGHALAEVRRGLWAKSSRTREAAIRAVGILRDTLAVPRLIDEVGAEHSEVREAALQALCSITGQQFGLRYDLWRAWYHEHGRESRMEWLESAARHRLDSVRRWAAEEIARICEYENSEDDTPTQFMSRSALGLTHVALNGAAAGANDDPGAPSPE